MLKSESYRKGIVYSVFFNFIARGIAFLNAFVIAFYFGANSTTDLYFYILSFVTIVASFINGMDTFVLIPEAMRLRHQKSEVSSMKFLNFFLYLYFVIGVVIALVIVINPTSLYFHISKFGYPQLADNVSLLYFSAILILLVLMTNLQTSIFISYRYFTMPMVVSMVNNILSLVLIIWLHNKYGIKSGIIGMIGGYLLNFIFLAWYMKRKLHWNFGFARPGLTRLTKRNLLFLQGSNIFPYLRSYISVFLLSGLPVGTVASYNFGQQLASIPESMLLNQFGSVTGIKMNELYAQKKYEEINNIFLKSSKLLLFLLFPIAGLIFLYSYEIVYFLYARGKFDDAAVAEVSRFLKYLALLLPMSVLMNMVSKVFTAFQKINLAFFYNVFINLFLIGLIVAGVYFYGVKGYLLAFLVGYMIVIFVLYFLLRLTIHEIKYFESLLFFFKALLLNASITAALWWLKQNSGDIKIPILLKMAIGGALYAVFLYAGSGIFGMKSFFNRKQYIR